MRDERERDRGEPRAEKRDDLGKQQAAIDGMGEHHAHDGEDSPTAAPAHRSGLPAALVAAYRAAWYRVELADGAETFRIGAPAPRTQAWLHARGRAGAVLVTACNPRGERLGEAANRAAMARLRAVVAARPWPFLAGAGGDDAGAWPPEPSLLVACDSVAEAAALGRMFDQNAVVWLPAEGPAQLVLVR